MISARKWLIFKHVLVEEASMDNTLYDVFLLHPLV